MYTSLIFLNYKDRTTRAQTQNEICWSDDDLLAEQDASKIVKKYLTDSEVM